LVESGLYVEWRVTADHADSWRENAPPYDFTWSARINPHLGADNDAAEEAARTFIRQMTERGVFERVRLWRRKVTISKWTEIEA
jgi:hypothetical protein